MAKPNKLKSYCKRYFENEKYQLEQMIADTGLDGKTCIDRLYDYKEEVFGEFVSERYYGAFG